MTGTEDLPGALRVTKEGNRLVVLAPWRGAERLQDRLRRGGICSTIHWEPWSEHACLELPPGADPTQAQQAVDAWAREEPAALAP
jgi:hypothetical protein